MSRLALAMVPAKRAPGIARRCQGDRRRNDCGLPRPVCLCAVEQTVPQRLKASPARIYTARLKPCRSYRALELKGQQATITLLASESRPTLIHTSDGSEYQS